jgi:hypothetical protein
MYTLSAEGLVAFLFPLALVSRLSSACSKAIKLTLSGDAVLIISLRQRKLGQQPCC